MTDYRNVLIYGEIDGDQLSSLTTQIIRIGKALAENLHEELYVVFLSGESQSAAKKGYGYGADKARQRSVPLYRLTQCEDGPYRRFVIFRLQVCRIIHAWLR